MCFALQETSEGAVLCPWGVITTDLIKGDKRRNGHSTKGALCPRPTQPSQSAALSSDSKQNSSGMFLMHSPLGSHNITATLSEHRPNGHKCRTFSKEVTQKCGLRRCLQTKPKKGEGVLECCNNRKAIIEDFGSWKGDLGSGAEKRRHVASQHVTFYVFSCLVCMQRRDSFSSVKGGEIEKREWRNDALPCVQHNATKYNSDGSCTILWSNCLFVHRPESGLDSSVADGTKKMLLKHFHWAKNASMFAFAQ